MIVLKFQFFHLKNPLLLTIDVLDKYWYHTAVKYITQIPRTEINKKKPLGDCVYNAPLFVATMSCYIDIE